MSFIIIKRMLMLKDIHFDKKLLPSYANYGKRKL